MYNQNKNLHRTVLMDENRVAAYMTRVMGWMSAGLAITFLTAWIVYITPAVQDFVFGSDFMFYGIVIGQLALVFILSMAVERMSSTTALLMFMAYSTLTGVTLSCVMFIYELGSILYVLGLTSVIFLIMAVYGFVTRKDLTRLGAMCFFGLIGIILASVFNFFMRSEGLDYLISYAGIIIFIGFTAYDTQRIKNKYMYDTSRGADDNSDYIQKYAIMGALILYLDFINLFLKLLRVMGKRKR
jgi:FtsH-binding integral membrane protein